MTERNHWLVAAPPPSREALEALKQALARHRSTIWLTLPEAVKVSDMDGESLQAYLEEADYRGAMQYWWRACRADR